MLAHGLHITGEGPIASPENQTDIPLRGICAKLRKVDFRNHLEEIGLKVHSPALVQNHILDAVRGSEIDIVLVGVVVNAGLEGNSLEIPVVPPVPGNLSGTHPGEISLSRLGKTPDHVAFGKLTVFLRHYHHTPRQSLARIAFINERLAGTDHSLKHVVIALLDILWIRSIYALKAVIALGIAQIHAGIVQEVALGNAELHSVVGAQRNRQESEAFRSPFREIEYAVEILERIVELLVPRLFRAHVRSPHLIVRRECELSLFGNHGDAFLSYETVCSAVVVNPEDEVEIL